MAAYLRSRTAAVKKAFSSRENFIRSLEVGDTEFSEAKKGKIQLSNAHLDPTPPEERTWTWFHFTALWLGYGFSVELWNIGSGMITAGLTWYEAMVCVFISHLLGAIGIVLNGRVGSVYHIGFPVAQRASFGIYGSFFVILLRSAIGLIWTGVQCYQGGLFLGLSLRAAFGHKFTDIENTFPAKIGLTVQALIGTLIFFFATFPLLSIAPHKSKHLWTLKAVMMPIPILGLFIYCVKQTGGSTGTFEGQTRIRGSSLAWAMLASINSIMGKTSTSTINQPDLTRFAKTSVSPVWSQLIMLPISNTIVCLIGIFATSSLQVSWGAEETPWAIWSLCSAIMDRHWTAGVRCAMFLVGLIFAMSVFVANASVNVLMFGADMSALFPRWIDTNRGMQLSYILGILIQPWYILASAASFMTFLGGYSLYLGSLLGATAADYYYRRGNLSVHGLYTGDNTSAYWYTYGTNWRAFAAFLVGCVPPTPGFIASFGYAMPVGAIRLYNLGWVFSVVTSVPTYIALCYFFPPAQFAEARSAGFEQWAIDQKELLDRTLPTGVSDKTESLSSDEKVDATRGEVLPVV